MRRLVLNVLLGIVTVASLALGIMFTDDIFTYVSSGEQFSGTGSHLLPVFGVGVPLILFFLPPSCCIILFATSVVINRSTIAENMKKLVYSKNGVVDEIKATGEEERDRVIEGVDSVSMKCPKCGEKIIGLVGEEKKCSSCGQKVKVLNA